MASRTSNEFSERYLAAEVACHMQAMQGPIVLRVSHGSQKTLGISIGYFITDIVIMTIHYPEVSNAYPSLLKRLQKTEKQKPSTDARMSTPVNINR